MAKNNYEIVVGNVGTMNYTSKKLAEECYTTYVSHSKTHTTRASGENVTMLLNGEIVKEHIGDNESD